eukprot:6583906-Prymnesium_polylepis.1
MGGGTACGRRAGGGEGGRGCRLTSSLLPRSNALGLLGPALSAPTSPKRNTSYRRSRPSFLSGILRI